MNENKNQPEIENGTPGSSKKKRLWTVLFVLINIAVVAATAIHEFSGSNAKPFTLKFSKEAVFFLGCTALCLVAALLAESLKYLLMMRSLKEKPSLRVAFETAALGKYYDCITPSGAGGQPFQIYWLHRHGYSDGGSSAMTLTAYITMQAAFIVLALAVFIALPAVDVEALRFTAYFGLFLLAVIPGLIILFSIRPNLVKRLVSFVIRLGGKLRLVKNTEETTQRILEMLDSYHASFSEISRDKPALCGLMLLSLVYRIALCCMPYFVLKMFGAPVAFLHIFAATVYIYASVALIPTPGNAGAAEGAFYLVFSATGSDGVFWAMLIWRLFSHYSFIIIGAAVYGYNALEKRRARGGKRNEPV